MKQSKFNDARPTRAHLLAYLAQRERGNRSKTTAGTSRKAAAVDAPVCVALF